MTPVRAPRDHVTLPIAAVLWLGLAALAVLVRPPLPVDETRYLTVAWEMWQSGNWLVPHLNGETYHHKPPLLFWLINAVWMFFGVSAETARLVAPVFSLITLWAGTALARALWPDRPAVAGFMPLVMIGCFFWAVFSTLTMFDMMLTAFALLALWGVIVAWRTGSNTGFVVFAVATGLGVLTKGPVILLHAAPALLLAPLWGPLMGNAIGGRVPRGGWKRWYILSALAIAGAAVIALAWAIPAAIAGGADFAEKIFWGQSAGRVVNSFDHARPWWFYLAVTPALTLPWLVWPSVWHGLWLEAVRRVNIGPAAFLLCWLVPAFAVFSLVSGKNPHYVLPEVVGLCLIFAAALAGVQAAQAAAADTDEGPNAGKIARPHWIDRAPFAVFVVLGAALTAVPFLNTVRDNPAWWSDDVAGMTGVVVVGLALIALLVAPARCDRRATVIAGLTAVFIAMLHIAATPLLHAKLDLRPVAHRLADWEGAGRPLAHFGSYHGTYQFLGRLERPMAIIGRETGETEAWINANPDGVIVSYHPWLPEGAEPIATYPFRNLMVTLWNAADVAHDPGIAGRPGEHERPPGASASAIDPVDLPADAPPDSPPDLGEPEKN